MGDHHPLAVLDILRAGLGIMKTIPNVIGSALAWPLLRNGRASTYYRHVMYAAIRELAGNIPTQAIVGLSPTTDEAYISFMKSVKCPTNTVVLDNGTRGHWIGDSSAENVLFYCHGGGYAVYATMTHIQTLWEIVQELQVAGKSLAVFVLSYDVSSTAPYPRQLQQASTLLSYLVETINKYPSNILIAGDSAGAHLALSLISHINHPHPQVPPITLPLETPFLGAVLLSPWVTFDTESSDSMKRNRTRDILNIPSLSKWARRFTGAAPRDNYLDPLGAPSNWWAGLPVQDVLIISGTDEIFVDDIEEFARKVSLVHPRVAHFSASGEAHIQVFTGSMIREEGSKQRSAFVEWIRVRV